MREYSKHDKVSTPVNRLNCLELGDEPVRANKIQHDNETTSSSARKQSNESWRYLPELLFECPSKQSAQGSNDFLVSADLPKEEKEKPRLKSLSAQEKERVTYLQNVLRLRYPATIARELKQAESAAHTEVIRSLKGKGFPDNVDDYSNQQREQYTQEREKLTKEKKDIILDKLRDKLDALDAEVGKEFGPGTKAVYREYIQWLLREGYPKIQGLQAQFQKLPPPGSPTRLVSDIAPGQDGKGKDMGPRDPRTSLNELGKGIYDLKIDTNSIPTSKDLDRLGEILLQMRKSTEELNADRLPYESRVLFRSIKKLEGLPSTWDVDEYKGSDEQAYNKQFVKASGLAFKVRTYLQLAIDSDRLNFVRNKSIDEIRKELHIPAHWKIELDPDTKKITKLDLGLPKDLCLIHPANKARIDDLAGWLSKDGKRIREAVIDTIHKQKEPEKFLYWGEVEIPPGQKINGAACNLLWSSYDAKEVTIDGKKKIAVTYTMQPKDAHWYSAYNLVGLSDVGQKLTETKYHDPDALVMVRRGLDSIEPMRADELAGYKAHCKSWYCLEKGVSLFADLGMMMSGWGGIKVARLAAKSGDAALKISASQLGWQLCKNRGRIALGASGILLNNAHFKHDEALQTLLNIRGAVMAVDIFSGAGSELRSWAGLANPSSTAHKLSEVTKQLPGLFKTMSEANHVNLALVTGGFSYILYEDIRKQIIRPDLDESLAPFPFADKLIGADNDDKNSAKRTKWLQGYAEQLDLKKDSKAQAKKLIADTSRLLATSPAERNTDEFADNLKARKDSLAAIIKDVKTDKDVRLIATSCLIATLRLIDKQLPDNVFVANVGGEQDNNLTRSDLVTMLSEPSSKFGVRRLPAEELLVELKNMSPIEYGKSLQRILDRSASRGNKKEHAWAKERLNYVEAVNNALYGKYDRKTELELSHRFLSDYEKLMLPGVAAATAAELKSIVAETKRLLTLKETDPKAFEKDVVSFKEKLIGYCRTGTGQEIADEEQKLSNEKGRPVKVDDKQRLENDIKGNGASRLNKDLRTISASALLLLARDNNGKITKDALVAERELDVPKYEYRVYEQTVEGSPHKVQRTVESHKHKQAITVGDALEILHRDTADRSAGSRALVAADMLINTGQIDPAGVAAMLRDCLVPRPGMKPSEAEKIWAMERLGFLANTQRVKEFYAKTHLSEDECAEERARCFLVSFEDLQNTVKSIAGNAAESADNRALAGSILRALKDEPLACHKLLLKAVDERRKSQEAAPGKYSASVVAELKQQLKSKDTFQQLRAGEVLHEMGQLSTKDFNSLLVTCLGEKGKRNDSVCEEAINLFKINGPNDLSENEREKVAKIIAETPSRENIPIKLAILERIKSFVTASESETVSRSILPQFRDPNTDSGLRAAYVKALGELGAEGSQFQLLSLLNPSVESSAAVRLAAVNALDAMSFTGLHEHLRKFRSKEHDLAVRARIDDLLFSSPPPDTEIYTLRWKAAGAYYNKLLSEGQGSLDEEDVREYLTKNGNWKSPRGHTGNCLLDLTNCQNQDWNNYVPKRTPEWAIALWRGIVNVSIDCPGQVTPIYRDIYPYSEYNRTRAHKQWNEAAMKALDQIGHEAIKGEGQAILTLGYLAATNCDKLDNQNRDAAMKKIAHYLNESAATGHSDPKVMMTAIESALTSTVATADQKLLLLKGLNTTCTKGANDNGVTAVGKAGYAKVLLEAYYKELRRISGSTNESKKAKSVAFQKAALEHFAKLMPRGYLGDLDQGSLLHRNSEIRKLEKQIAANLRDKITPIWNGIKTAPVSAERGAQIIRKALVPDDARSKDWYADNIVHDIAKACKGSPIVSEKDRRIRPLVLALKNDDNKIKLVCARVLLDPENSAVPHEARIAAVRALAQAGVYGACCGRLGFVQDAQEILSLASKLQDKELGEVFLKTRIEARAKLENTDYIGVRGVKSDTSKLEYDEQKRIEKITYPKLPGRLGISQRAVARDKDGNITKHIAAVPNSPQVERVRQRDRDGRLTNDWERADNPKLKWKGTIDIARDGTITETTLSEAGKRIRKDVIYTNGTSSSVDFNDQGKPTAVTFPNGDTLKYRYSASGKLSGFQWDGYVECKLNEGFRKDSVGNYVTCAVDAEGNYSESFNDGTRWSTCVSGEQWDRLYVGPPEHVLRGMQALESAKTAHGGACYATAISRTIKDFGPILDKNDPRLPLFLELAKKPATDAGAESMAILLDKSTTVLPQEKKKELLAGLSQIAVQAAKLRDEDLEQQRDKVAWVLKDDKEALVELRRAVDECAQKAFWSGKLNFGDMFTFDVSDHSESHLETFLNQMRRANSRQNWLDIWKQSRGIASIAKEHPTDAVCRQAGQAISQFENTFRRRWDSAWFSDLTPKEGAKVLARCLTEDSKSAQWTADGTISEMARACKDARLVDKDPRIRVLVSGLKHENTKVKLCIARILLDPINAGVSKEARLLAGKAVAEISRASEFAADGVATRADVDYIRTTFVKHNNVKDLKTP